jgi:N-glycosylase/DNA lyase
MELPQELKNKYKELKSEIKTKLKEFEAVSENQYFYELCFCICTPQSKAESAFAVQKILQEKDFLNNNFDVTPILREPSHYIRFHNQKALRLQAIKENWKVILAKIKDNSTGQEKRNWFNQNVKGIGMKESAHYLRNIGFKNLGILDRHILKHLITCRVFDGNIKGEILFFDNYGNAITNIEIGVGTINFRDKKLKINITFSDVEIGELVVYVGSMNTIEIAIRNSNFKKIFEARNNEKIILKEDY